MKKTMFKIARVKNDKQFYDKFPTEEDFMAKHGAEFNAKCGGSFKKAQLGDLLKQAAPMVSGLFGNKGESAANIGQNAMAGFGGIGATGVGAAQSGIDAATGGGAEGFMGDMGGVAGVAQVAGDIIGGISAIKGQKNALKEAKQMAGVSGVTADAAESTDVDARRQQSEMMQDRYNTQMRPINGEELFPVDGRGTNVLAKSGIHIKPENRGKFTAWAKNKGMSIQEAASKVMANTENYSPTTVKRANFAKNAAKWHHAKGGMEASGFESFMGGAGGQQLSSMAGNLMGNDAGSQIGGGVGKLAGTAIGGPLGGKLGEIGGKLIGGAIDTTAEEIEGQQDILNRNIDRTKWANYDTSSAYTKYGGNFKDNDVSYMKNGGMTMMEDNGDLQMGPEGRLEPLSMNPYTAGDGETNMIEGPSHAEGGTRLNYGGNNIEAEREPVMKMQHGGEGEGLVIYGDLPISKETAGMMGDPEAKGKKFKTYISKITEKETKSNIKADKAAKIASELTPINKFDRLKLGTQEIIQKGSDTKLKMYAEQKENAAMAQNAINETAEELGADPVAIARGKFKKASKSQMAKYGKTMFAQKGVNVFKSEKEVQAAGYEKNAKGEWEKLIEEGAPAWGDVIKGTPGTEGRAAVPGKVIKPAEKQMDNWADYLAKETSQQKEIRHAREVAEGRRTEEISAIEAQPGIPDRPFQVEAIDPVYDYARIESDPANPKNKGKFNPMPYLNALVPLFGKGSDAEGLQGNQLMGEMFALSNNQVEPVYAQSYRPSLDVPYDISLQDRLNRVTSGVRAASRMAQGNPAAQAMLQAQGYAQDQPILGEQFRANQAMKNQVYSGNRATLNDAQLKNIGIYDQQANRQAIAKSNTKEATQAALNSISSKYQQNKLEQRTLKTYENMYNYRFGNNYLARNVNDPVDFEAMKRNAEINGSGMREGMVPVYNKKGEITGYKVIDGSETSLRGTDYNPDAQYNTKFGGTITRSLKKF